MTLPRMYLLPAVSKHRVHRKGAVWLRQSRNAAPRAATLLMHCPCLQACQPLAHPMASKEMSMRFSAQYSSNCDTPLQQFMEGRRSGRAHSTLAAECGRQSMWQPQLGRHERPPEQTAGLQRQPQQVLPKLAAAAR